MLQKIFSVDIVLARSKCDLKTEKKRGGNLVEVDWSEGVARKTPTPASGGWWNNGHEWNGTALKYAHCTPLAYTLRMHLAGVKFFEILSNLVIPYYYTLSYNEGLPGPHDKSKGRAYKQTKRTAQNVMVASPNHPHFVWLHCPHPQISADDPAGA